MVSVDANFDGTCALIRVNHSLDLQLLTYNNNNINNTVIMKSRLIVPYEWALTR
jgi:hypothetical protein